MENIFAKIVLGHLFGDYMFQSKEMALKKTEKSLKGLTWCTIHCIIYTLCLCIFLWNFKPFIIFLIFLSHWPLDRWSLGSKWLNLIKGRDILTAYNSKEKYHEIDLSFSCFVYAVVDNTMHITIIWLIMINL